MRQILSSPACHFVRAAKWPKAPGNDDSKFRAASLELHEAPLAFCVSNEPGLSQIHVLIYIYIYSMYTVYISYIYIYTLEPPAQSADIVLSLFSFFLSPLSPWCVLSSSLPPSAPQPPHPPKPLSPQSPSLVCMYVCIHVYMYVSNVCM